MSAEKQFESVLNDGAGGNVTYIRPKELAEAGTTGVVAEGIFQGSVPNRFDETKSDFKLEMEDGSITILNHAGSLANQLKRVTPGAYVRINYNGMQPMKSGKLAGKSAHAFVVEVEVTD